MGCGVGLAVGVGACVGTGVAVGTGVGVGVDVGVAVGTGVGDGAGRGVGVGTAMGNGVGVGVGTGVGVGLGAGVEAGAGAPAGAGLGNRIAEASVASRDGVSGAGETVEDGTAGCSDSGDGTATGSAVGTGNWDSSELLSMLDSLPEISAGTKERLETGAGKTVGKGSETGVGMGKGIIGA